MTTEFRNRHSPDNHERVTVLAFPKRTLFFFYWGTSYKINLHTLQNR